MFGIKIPSIRQAGSSVWGDLAIPQMNRDTKFSCSGGETNMSTWQIFLPEKTGPQICNISNASLRINGRKSSRQEVFCEKGLLRNFTKFTGKYLCQSFVFSCEFC